MIEDYSIRFNTEFKYGYEDHLFNTDACSKAIQVQIIPDVLYTWIQRKSVSTSRKSSPEAIENRLQSITKWREEEMTVAEELKATMDEKYTRQFEYLKFYAQELKKLSCSMSVKKEKYGMIRDSWINNQKASYGGG